MPPTTFTRDQIGKMSKKCTRDHNNLLLHNSICLTRRPWRNVIQIWSQIPKIYSSGRARGTATKCTNLYIYIKARSWCCASLGHYYKSCCNMRGWWWPFRRTEAALWFQKGQICFYCGKVENYYYYKYHVIVIYYAHRVLYKYILYLFLRRYCYSMMDVAFALWPPPPTPPQNTCTRHTHTHRFIIASSRAIRRTHTQPHTVQCNHTHTHDDEPAKVQFFSPPK